jgi:chromosome segregation ATPase
MASSSPITLEGLAGVLEHHIEATAARFEDVERQIQSLAREVHTLVGQGEARFALVPDHGLQMMALAQQVAEQQAQIRQTLHRFEQNDPRWERNDARWEQRDREIQEMLRRLDEHAARLGQHDDYIRRMLDLLERRGGDGGPERA